MIVRVLGDAYNGVGSVFTNLLMIFSLADLGVGTAIIYSLYKPLAEGDQLKIRQLMGLYARAYNIIGAAIIGLGLIVYPFLDVIIKLDTPLPDMTLIYALFVLGTASSYFFVYKSSLIIADQKNYIFTNVTYLTSIINYALQIAVIIIYKSYVIALSIQVVTNVIQNLILMYIANKKYPYIKGSIAEKLPDEDRKKIFSNIGSIVFYRIGAVVTNGTNSIVISAFVNTIAAGLYLNYMLIINTIKNIVLQVFKSTQASVGNLNTIDDRDRLYAVYEMINFANFVIIGFCSVCFYVLLNPFVHFWLGMSRVLTMHTVFWLVLGFYLTGIRNPSQMFRETMGVFRQGRWVPLIGAIANVGVSLVLVQFFGIDGVLMGTVISTLAVLLWWEPLVLHRHGFNRSIKTYYRKQIIYFVVTVAMVGSTYYLADVVFYGTDFIHIVGRLAICLIVPTAFIVAFFSRTMEYRELKSKILGVIRRKFNKSA